MKLGTVLCATLTLAGLAGAVAPPAARWVWWEGEAPARTNFPPRHSFEPADAREAALLSGGKWLGASEDGRQKLFAEYEVQVPAAGEFGFYVRKFWQHGPFRWRFGNGEWRTCSKNEVLLDDVSIRQFVGANWVRLGDVKLPAGRQTLRMELLENQGAAAFDAFLLTQDVFLPQGKLKPGERYGNAPTGWFTFEPGLDPFSASPIDLRSMNEKFAGEKGRILVKGDALIHEKTGEPVRFWSINTNVDAVRMDRRRVDLFARHLAKLGVNMVRVHGSINLPDLSVNQSVIEPYQYFVAAMKREGIYVTLSIYFPLWVQMRPEMGWEGYTGGHPFALLYFDSKFQERYRSWWRALLTSKNPHGVPLAEEPAVAVAELVNEDSFLFWTFTPYENIPGPQIAKLEKRFGDWLGKRYGSLAAARSRWGGAAIRGDVPAEGRVGFRALWELANNRDLRSQDTVRFLMEVQTGFYRDTIAFLKRDLGYRGLTYASNWVTADARVLGPADKHSNAVADIMDRHGYYGGAHQGDRASYMLSDGDRFDDRAAVRFEGEKRGDAKSFDLPIWDLAYNGKPSILTEFNWTMPNRFRGEMPLLAAAYGALQGSDGLYPFATGGPYWGNVLGKFPIHSPAILGQSPAVAVLYRQGLVKTAGPAVRVEMTQAQLEALEGAPVVQAVNLDETRARDLPPGQAAPVDRVKAIDPLAYAVGRVELRVVPQGARSEVVDLRKFIDRAGQTVRSLTGELNWNWGKGLVTVNAPAAQGVTGFLAAAGEVRLGTLRVTSPLEFGTILLVSLDGQPLATSKRMLLQVFSEEKNSGFEAPGEGLRTMVRVGGPPVLVRNLAGQVTLVRPDAARLRVRALDLNGYPVGQPTVGGSLALRPNTLWYAIEVP